MARIIGARRSLWSLVLDQLFSSVLAGIRRRVRVKSQFNGIVVPIDDVIGIRVTTTGRWESTQTDAIAALTDTRASAGFGIDTNGICIDVGANIGLYTILFASRFNSVLSVEANPVTFKVLEANVAIKGLTNVHCVCRGASSEPRQAMLQMPNNGNLGWATLHGWDVPGGSVELPVSLDRLDTLYEQYGSGAERVAMIKIDVERHELEVLRGATGILGKWGPAVLFELLDVEDGRSCISLLKDHGYTRFFTFRRTIKGKGIRGLADNLFRGVPVVMSEIDFSQLSGETLVCAVRPERRSLEGQASVTAGAA